MRDEGVVFNAVTPVGLKRGGIPVNNKRFHILYILTDPFGMGGVQSDIKSLGPYFVSQGHHVTVLSPPGDQIPALLKGGVRHIAFNVRFRSLSEFRRQSQSLRRLIMNVGPTVLAPQSIRASWACHAAAREMPMKKITTIHNIHNSLNSLWAGFILDRCSDWVIFESDHEHERLTGRGLSRGKTQIIPSGIDTGIFYRTPRPEALWEDLPEKSRNCIIFGCIARLSPEKGHSDLLKAYRKLLDRYPQTRLLLVGDGPLREKIAEQIRELDLGLHVFLVGQRSNIREYLNFIDVFVLASTRESLPRAAREAMACGKPVVATRVGATREVVEDGKTGLLVPPARPDLLAKAMEELILSPERRKEMGDAALCLIRERFSQTRWLEENEKIYAMAGV